MGGAKKVDEHVRDISEKVYRLKLDRECGHGTAKMTDDAIAAGLPGPDGKPRITIRDRAASYDKLTRLYLQVLELVHADVSHIS